MESKMSGGQDIMRLLRLLEDEIQNSKKAMFGGGRIVDDNKCTAIINDIIFNLPKALSQAVSIVRERDTIIRDAKERAEKIVGDAEDKADTLVDNSEILARAREEAEYIIADAKSYAEMLKKESLGGVEQMLARTEDNLAEILEVVQNTRDDVYDMRHQGDNNIPNNMQSNGNEQNNSYGDANTNFNRNQNRNADNNYVNAGYRTDNIVFTDSDGNNY